MRDFREINVMWVVSHAGISKPPVLRRGGGLVGGWCVLDPGPVVGLGGVQ